MKKILSILLCFVICFSFIVSLADMPKYLEEFESGDFKFTFQLKFNEKLPDILRLYLVANDIDLTLIENLSFTCYGTAEVYDKNIPKLKGYVKVPKEELQKFADLLGGYEDYASGDLECWIDMDFTDPENIVYNVTTKFPGEEKYIYYDYAGDYVDFDTNEVPKFNSKIIKLYEEYMKELQKVKIDETYNEKSGDYKLVVPKESVYDAVDIIIDYTFNNFDYIFDTYLMDIIYYDDSFEYYDTIYLKPSRVEVLAYRAVAKEFAEIFREMDIFADDALVYEAKQDKQTGDIFLAESVNLKTNIYDAAIATTFVKEEEIKTLFGENVKREEFDIDLTVYVEYEYKNVNKAKVQFPQLNEENSIDYFKQQQLEWIDYFKQQQLEWEELNKLYEINENFFIYVGHERVLFDTTPFIENGTTFVPIRKLMNALGVADENISYEDGVVTILGEDIEIKLIIGSTTAYVDGEEATLLAPPVIKDDRTYVPLRFISENLGYIVEFDSLEYWNGEVAYMIGILSPESYYEYNGEEDEFYDEYENDEDF